MYARNTIYYIIYSNDVCTEYYIYNTIYYII